MAIELSEYIETLDEVTAVESGMEMMVRTEAGLLVRGSANLFGGLLGNTAMRFDETYHQHLNIGAFFARDTAHSLKFFWEFCIQIQEGMEYAVSPGYGGAHEGLFGFNGAAAGYGLMSGNVRINDATFSLGPSIDGVYENDDHIFAYGSDGKYARLWKNGVLVWEAPIAGERRTANAPENTVTFLFGSNHSSGHGLLRWVRAFEGFCPVAGRRHYKPEITPKNSYYIDGKHRTCQLLIDISTGTLADHSSGFSNGVRQKIRNTVVAASGITSNGNARCVVTAAGMPNSPKTVTIAVTTALTTDALIAAAFRAALVADDDVHSFFSVAGTGANVELIADEPAANDATMNLTIEDVTSAGITEDTTATTIDTGVKGELAKHPAYRASEDDGGDTGVFGEITAAGRLQNLPTFERVEFARPSVYKGTPLSIPGGLHGYDDFSRVDEDKMWEDTLSLGVLRTNQSWTNDADIGISDAKAFNNGATCTIYAPNIAHYDRGSVTQDIELVRVGTSDEFGVTGRYTDIDNRIVCTSASAGTQYWEVYDVIGGTPNSIASIDMGGTSFTRVRMTISGTTVTVYADGVSKGTGTTAISTGTRCGFEVYGLLARIKEFKSA